MIPNNELSKLERSRTPVGLIEQPNAPYVDQRDPRDPTALYDRYGNKVNSSFIDTSPK